MSIGYVPRIDNGYKRISGNGTYNWCKLATITIKGDYINYPISFEIDGRGRGRSIVQVMFASTDKTDPSLTSFKSDLDTNFYIKKVATSTWELYGNYIGVYGDFTLYRVLTWLKSSRVEIDTTISNLSSEPSDTTRVSLNCVPTSGGAVMTGRSLGRADNTGNLNICGGNIWSDGGFVALRGKNSDLPNQAGTAVIGAANSDTDFRSMTLKPDGTWTWDGTAVQITSDQRLKQQITEIDDKLLDAWEDVDLVQFKYNDAVNEKGNAARLHTGYVVQQIDEACKSHNVDISDYGLYCHEEYPEETEEVEVTQDDGTTKKETRVIREASEHYSLRYTETLVVECAYLRREVSRLKQQNENFEQCFKILEQSVK